MASINGVQLKAIKHFETTRGVGFTANVYIDNKKAGIASDEGHGGMVDTRFESRELQETFLKRSKDYFEANPSVMDSPEDFIEELLQFAEAEQMFKKNTKKGFPILLVMNFYKRTDSLESVFANGFKEPQLVSVKDDSTLRVQLMEKNPVEHKVYRSVEDFKI